MAIKYNKAHELAQSLKKKKKYENILNVLENNRTTTNAIQNRTTREINNRILNGGTIAPVYSSDASSKKTQLNIISEEEQKAKLKTPLELLQEQQQKQFEEKQQKSKEASEKRVEQKKKDEKEEDPDTIYQNKVLKNVMSEYSGLSKEKLLKLREENIKQQKKIMEKGDYKTQNRKWWNSDDNILENAGNVLYKLFAEDDPYTFSDEYNEAVARQMAIEKALEDTNLKNKKYSKGVMGAIEKSEETLASGTMRGLRGIEETTRKILGQEETKTEKEMLNTLGGRQTYIEKLGSKAIEETDNKVGKAALEVTQSIGQMMPQMMLPGGKAATVIGAANFGGSAYSDAKDQGYTEEQATAYGIAVGGLETLLNKLLPSFDINGKNIYGKTATDKLTSKVMSKIAGNEFLKRTITQGMGEFTEEYLQEFLEPIVRETLLEEDNGVGIVGSKDAGELAKNIASYTAQNFFSKENAYAGMLGFVSSASLGAQSNIQAQKYTKQTGRNPDTGLTQNEQSVIDNVVKSRTSELTKNNIIEQETNKIIKEQEKTLGTLTEAEKTGIRNSVLAKVENSEIDVTNGKLSKKELTKIEEEVRKELDRGEIDIDVIESTLSSEKTTRIRELQEQLGKTTNEQEKAQIEAQISELTNAKNTELKEMLQKDNLLQNSYREANLKNEQFTYEVQDTDSEYKKSLAEDFKRVANNTTKSHETFEMISKIAEDKETSYGVINNEQLKQLGYDVEGKDVNGLVRVNKDGSQKVLINIDSNKAINRIVGHETTHLLEGTNEYNEFKEFAKQYATTKGDYDTRLKSTQALYKDIESADIEAEVTADIVGDYLFTDQDFINNLSTEKPTIFQRVYNEIKHLYNLATAGSTEQRQLLQLKKSFEKAYRENVKGTETDTKYSLLENKEKFYANEKEYKHGYHYNIKDGGRADNVMVTVTKNGYVLNNALLSDEIKGKGEGTKIALDLNEQSLKETGKPLQSLPEYNKVGLKNHTEEGKGLWESLVKKGYAVKNADNSYSMLATAPTEAEYINQTTKYSLTDNQGREIFEMDINDLTFQDEKYGKIIEEEDQGRIDIFKNILKNKQDYYGFEYEDIAAPIVLRQEKVNGKWKMYDGQHRYIAYKQLGYDKVPVVFKENAKHFTTNNPDIRYSLSPDYGMSHRPSTDYGDASNFEENMPDVFEHPEWYMFGGDGWYKKAYNESWNALKKVRNNPDGEITIYRATIGDTFNEGDWVSPSKAYAEWHNYSNLDGKGKVIELKVKAKDIRFAGDDLNEFGYFPNGVDEYSLSNFNEQDLPSKKARNDVYGKDIKLQVEEAIAPLKEEVKTLTKEITDLRENVAPISLEEAEMLRKESFNSITDKDIAPIKEDTAPEYQYENDNKGTESIYNEISNDTPKNDRELIDEIRDTFSVKQYEARNILDDIKKAESKKEIYDILYRNRYYEEQTGENTKELKKRIRNTKLDMSNEKLQMGKQDYNEFRKRNFGNLKLGNDGMSVDSFYQELSEMYPNYFEPSVNNVSDQLEVISDFMKTDHSTATMEMQKDELLFMADYYYNQLENRKLINDHYKSILENQPGKEVSDLYSFFGGEIPDEVMLSNIDNVAEKMIQEKQAKREKIEKNNTLNYIPQNPTKESAYDDPSITNPVDAFLNKELTNRFEKRTKQTVISKQKGKSAFRDTMSYLFVNKNRAIDKFSDEVGNKNIKILADHVNNVFGEISTNISKVQTDNNGKAIGKGITEIFNQARKSKLSEAFDDYLFHKSNIERHKNGKGSIVPANDSARLVLEYDKTYPEFKIWGDEVNNFNKNNLYKQVDAGLITKELADKITSMYDFYVPFFENIERDYVKTDTGEITSRSAVKRAKGGADKNLLGFEKAMMKQTQNTISSIRKNQLYREIIDSTHNKQIGMDLNDGTFADENGYYLTAYEDGSQVSANISKELYDGLNNNLEQTVKDIEQKLSLITKPLQALSNIRRNLLTNWSPTFIITNPIKDFQDAPLNSKYAKDWAVNYPKALKELTTGKGEHLETFLNMYGQANLMGDYSIDSGISDITKSVKIKGKSKLSVGALNELAELTPRYAEYLASIKNGASQMEALYNAREVTTNFGRGGVITKALNRNGFTFLNASVQGFNKLYRNFSGENGAKGVVNASLKALSLGVAPALYNALMFGLGDDEDEDYKVLPDYIKDNYYLIKTDNGNFIRIPKGRMISVFGSAGRRTLELMQGEKDAFDGYLKNAYSQVGISNPMESNILAPLIQAYGSENGKTWYGTDIVPSRLQDVPKDEQYDESIDKFSIWLGEKTGISPYKANYVIDQYTGGIGDMILPTITEEAQSDSDSLLGTSIAPLKDKFTADSTTDNKYVSEFYTKNDELKVKSNSSKATEEDLLVNQYMKSVSSEMGVLYSEMREVQANKNLSKSEKYNKAQAIKKQINELAEEGLNGYKNVNKTDNYAEVGGREFYKWTNDEGEVVWSKPDEAESDELNAMGLDIQEKSSYYTTKSKIYDIWDKYGDSDNYESKNKEIGQAIINSGLPDEAKYSLYDFSKGKYADTETTQALKLLDLDADTFISYASQTFKADKDSNGKSISGSKKKKVFDYINSMRNISFEQKAILAKLQYNNYDEWNYDIIDYLNNSSMTYEEMEFVLKQMGFKVKSDGTITWD